MSLFSGPFIANGKPILTMPGFLLEMYSFLFLLFIIPFMHGVYISMQMTMGHIPITFNYLEEMLEGIPTSRHLKTLLWTAIVMNNRVILC